MPATDDQRAQPPKNILIIRLGALGDIILTSGAVRDIRLAHPGATVHFLTSRPYAKLLARNPDIDQVVIDPRAHRLKFWELLALRKRLRALGINRVYDLQDSGRSRMYHRWLRPVEWVGIARGCSHPVSPESRHEPRALVNMAGRIRDAGIEPVHAQCPDVRWMADPVHDVLDANGMGGGFVLLIPGSSARHPQKRWPYYGELAERLQQAGYPCVTAPGPDELDLCAQVPATMLMRDHGAGGRKPLTYFELAGLAIKARYVIGNDTGPSHIAARCGAPGLALFGGHTPAFRTSLDSVWSVLEADDLAKLSVETVFEKAVADMKT